MTVFLFVSLLVMLAASVPIFIALCGSVTASFLLFSNMDTTIIIQRMFAGINKFSLMSIPLFVLAANLMSEGGISKRIINLANAFVGHIPGGLGMTAILASMFFGAISGSSPATVVAIGALLYPAMIEKGYSKEFSAGLITAAGSLGIIIPPSVNMIVYGTVTGASVGALFMSGFGAGIVYGLSFVVYTFFYAKRHPEIQRETRKTWGERLVAIKESIWGMGVPIIILGGIYGGIFTPTEAAAVAAVYAFICGVFIFRELNFGNIYKTIAAACSTNGTTMVIIGCATAFTRVLTIQQIPAMITQAILNFSTNKVVILILINILLLIVGCFMDTTPAMMVLSPILLPVATSLGLSPIHFGIIMVVNLAIGFITPPLGINLFVAARIGDVKLEVVCQGIIRFIIAMIVCLLAITFIPAISEFLPRLSGML